MKDLMIFDYNEYRTYLVEWLNHAKAAKKSSLTELANSIQVHPTFLSQVLKEKKELSLEQSILLCERLMLTQLETKYFLNLVNSSRSGHHKLSQFLDKERKSILGEKQRLETRLSDFKTLSEDEKALYYSTWIYSAVRVVTAIGDGQSAEFIRDKFNLDREETAKILSFLCQTGLCDLKEGVYKIAEKQIHLNNESPFINKHHTNWRLKALGAVDTKKQDELFFTMPMSIARKDFDKIREKIVTLIKESVQLAKDSKAEDLAALNIDLFWPRP